MQRCNNAVITIDDHDDDAYESTEGGSTPQVWSPQQQLQEDPTGQSGYNIEQSTSQSFSLAVSISEQTQDGDKPKDDAAGAWNEGESQPNDDSQGVDSALYDVLSNELMISPEELAQSQPLQRVLKSLRFENPGEAATSVLIRNKLRPRDGQKKVENTSHRPHHDKQGRLVTTRGKAVDLCDCLLSSCEGCHRPCKKCGSRKCSLQCRNGRQSVIDRVEYQCVKGRSPTINPHLR